MADFNQSPAGQAPVILTLSQLNMTIGATTDNVSTSTVFSSVFGTSGTLNIGPTTAVIATSTLSPVWRRPERIIPNG